MNLDRRLLQRGLDRQSPGGRSARTSLAFTVILGLLAGIVLVWQALFLSQAVSRAFLHHADLDALQPILIALLLLAFLRAALSWAAQVTAHRVAGLVKHRLRQELSTHLLKLGPAYTRGERTGELSNTLTEGIEALDAYLSQYLPQLALAALVPLTILLFVFPLDPLSGAVLLLTGPLIPIFMILIGNLADSLTQKQWASLSRMSAHFLDVLQGLTTLKLLGRSREQIETIALVSDRFRQSTMGVLRVAFLSALVLELLATISTAVVAVQIGLRLLYGYLVFEQAFFVLLLAPEFYLPLRLLGTRFHAGMSGVAAARRIFELLETEPALPPALPAASPPTAATDPGRRSLKGAIRFSDLHYSYPDSHQSALIDFSLEIQTGERIALVGPSGAGKSTLAHLLLRFLAPQGGSITIAGTPLQDLPLASWRGQIAWVPQHPHLFHATVRQNLSLTFGASPGSPDIELDRIIWAAKKAQAHDFIQALPQGYDTPIGERGARLSGGQAQRIALARAFLKDAPLLILDEATANLDPETETQIQDAIQELLGGRTALIIAHRLSTVTRAGRIVVLEAGRIVETGSHHSLMERPGLYRHLVTAYHAGNGA